MKEFFNYAYYRINNVYLKWDGEDGITSVIGVSMIQVLWFACIIVFFTKTLMPPLSLAPYSKTIAYVAAIILFIRIILNHKRYKGKFHLYKTKWDNATNADQTTKRYIDCFANGISLDFAICYC